MPGPDLRLTYIGGPTALVELGGPVIGFVLAFADQPQRALYISGDTVWYEGIAQVARRFSVRLALLFMGGRTRLCRSHHCSAAFRRLGPLLRVSNGDRAGLLRRRPRTLPAMAGTGSANSAFPWLKPGLAGSHSALLQSLLASRVTGLQLIGTGTPVGPSRISYENRTLQGHPARGSQGYRG